MAELCRECFIKTWYPTQSEIERIVMSEDKYCCEGCMKYSTYVDHIEPIKGGGTLKQHIATVHIPAKEFDRVNRLLSIESLEEMTDSELIEQGANTYQCDGIFCATFDDGSYINYDLCSGSTNYYDDVVWTSADGSRDVVLDCEFELDDIEVEIESELYIVRIIKG